MTRKMDANDKTVGRNLRTFRNMRGLSQTDIGDEIGVTFQQIQKYEKGTNSISSTRIPALCRILQIKPNQLFKGLLDEVDTAPLPDISPAALDFALHARFLKPKEMIALRQMVVAITDSR